MGILSLRIEKPENTPEVKRRLAEISGLKPFSEIIIFGVSFLATKTDGSEKEVDVFQFIREAFDEHLIECGEYQWGRKKLFWRYANKYRLERKVLWKNPFLKTKEERIDN